MYTFTWWQAVIIIMAVYWPVALLVSAAIVLIAFMGTTKAGWRIFWMIVALLISLPALWAFTGG